MCLSVSHIIRPCPSPKKVKQSQNFAKKVSTYASGVTKMLLSLINPKSTVYIPTFLLYKQLCELAQLESTH